jgi:hypothetical protein
VYGAAIATGTAQAFKNLFIWWHVRNVGRWMNLRAVITMIVLIWGPCIAACFLVKQALPQLPAAAQLVAGALICGVAALLYVRTRALSSSDRDILASVFHGREARLLEWIGIRRNAAVG